MLNEIKTTLDSLIIFNNLKNDEIIGHLYSLCEIDENNTELLVEKYSRFLSALLDKSKSFSDYLKEKVLENENIYTKAAVSDKTKKDFLEPQLKFELDKLSNIPVLLKGSLKPEVTNNFAISPLYEKQSLFEIYSEQIENIDKIGFGIFSKYNIFIYDNKKSFLPVGTHNVRSLNEMYDYTRERQKVIDNTKALIKGYPACNVLLYGDAGTGKSSTIKAIANEYKNKGLRLVEIKKEQIQKIPEIIEKIANNPLKFILFIDDVTFSPDDPDFCALKTILDGDSKGLSKNVAVYVTSNHRHLIKETANDRNGDIVNTVDNIQGILGLSARFGLTVTFLRPDKAVYSNIVINMAREKKINCDENNLVMKAEAFAIRNGGRTPRTAKQFIDLVYAGTEKVN